MIRYAAMNPMAERQRDGELDDSGMIEPKSGEEIEDGSHEVKSD